MRAAALLLFGSLITAQDRVMIFAAASVGEALRELAATCTAATVVISAGSTATLAKQIAAGAPADLFLAADGAWMDDLERRNLLVPGSRRDLLGNRLVLISPTSRPLTATLPGPLPTFTGRVALADPASVPAGRYAQAACTRLDWWEALQGRLAPAADVRAALHLVERDEAPLGFVYATDAAGSSRVSIVATVPEDLHPPIRYPLARLRTATPAAAAVAAFLAGPKAAEVFRRRGFTVLTP